MLQAAHHLFIYRQQQQQQQPRMFARSTQENITCPSPPAQAWPDDTIGHGIDFAGSDEHSMHGDIYEPIPVNMNNLEIIQPEHNGRLHNQLFLSTFVERSKHYVTAGIGKIKGNGHCPISNNKQDYQPSELVTNIPIPEWNFADVSSASSKSLREASHGHYSQIPDGANGEDGRHVRMSSSYNVSCDKVMQPSGGLNAIQSSSNGTPELPQSGYAAACSLSISNRSSSSCSLSISNRSSSSSWISTETFDDRWDQKFLQLLHFVRMHGHARVPVRYQSNLSLSKWAKRQRYQYKLKYEGKHSTLSDEREQKLIEIDFEWDIRCTVWEERFDELVEFKRLNGHMSVPIKCPDFPKLGSWVKCARRQGKLYARGEPSSMTADRAAKFQAIGFKWEARSRP